MQSEDLPTAVWPGTFRLFGVELRCHALSDGRRIIEEGSIAELMRAMAAEDGPEIEMEPAEAQRLARWRMEKPSCSA